MYNPYIMHEVVVTRNGQITLSKGLRKELGILEGDKIIMNKLKGVIILAKKDPAIWDKIGEFLPKNFGDVLEKIREPSTKRFKKLGII